MSGELAPEEHFGPYLVYERLGVGGMATVHRAVEHEGEGADRVVALKRLLPHLAEDASFIKAFVREAKLASILNHINIVQIYELGRVGTEYFISMEYIDGRDLRRILRHARKVTGPPPIHVTVGLMLQLCDALDYAHTKLDEDGRPLGLVHRDISPSNLIVTSAGHVKVIDFGIAKAQSNHLRTQTGRVKGKLAYMAPEAVSGSKDLDARSDVWACGVILHELITARPLFASKNEYQTLLKVQKGDIMPPSTFNQACPAELDAIVFRALARDPDDRFSSASEMRDELLALKRKYALQTGFKELASWIDWAFGLEPPGGFSGDTSGVVSVAGPSRIHEKTPRPPRNTEEDEAVEVVWGSGNNESEDGPVVLEEVPDVSDKARARRDTDDERFAEDEIPTPLPSHGTLPSIYGKPEMKVVPAAPDPKLFGADPLERPAPAPASKSSQRLSGPSVPMPARSKIPSSVQPIVPRTAPAPQMPRTVTGPQPIRTSSPSAPPTDARSRRSTAQGVHVDAPALADRLAAQRDRDDTETGDNAPLDAPTILRSATQSDTVLRADSLADQTNPLAKPVAPLSPEEQFGQDAAEVLAGVSADTDTAATQGGMHSFKEEPTTTPTMKPISTASVPVVRFSKGHTVPPLNESSARFDPRSVTTTPGVGALPSMQPAAARSLPSPSRPPTNAPVDIIAPQRSSKRWILVVVGVLLAGGTAALVAVSMTSSDAPATPSTTPVAAGDVPPALPPPPAPSAGKIKFELEPADADITIEGKLVHTGSPWSTEIPAGAHQVEIHKTGYKSWLTTMELSPNETATLRVVLEPMTTAIDATLTVSTTPPGLDVYIDGVLLPDKSPIKTTLKVGAHKIAVKQNGAEVWQQNVNAEASSDYEFNPSFTDDKKRERAQRPPRLPTTPTTDKASTKPTNPSDKPLDKALDVHSDKATDLRTDRASGSGSATPPVSSGSGASGSAAAPQKPPAAGSASAGSTAPVIPAPTGSTGSAAATPPPPPPTQQLDRPVGPRLPPTSTLK